MNFLWLDINASFSHSSLAFPALEAQLSSKVREQSVWKIVSGTTKSNKEQIISQIIAAVPNYVFATGWLFNIEYLLSVLCRVRALKPQVKIVLGGPEFLGDNRHFLHSNPFVSAVFKGEGEEVFPKFIEAAIAGKENPWATLPGFEYLFYTTDGQTEYIKSQAVAVKDFASLVPPEESRFFNWSKAFIQLETSRGCFNTCRFCISGIESLPIQNISIENIRERLHNIVDKGIKEIRVLDRTFNGNQMRAIELLSLFEEFKGKLKFHLEVHPALLNAAVKEKLASIPHNLLHVEAGIQSLNEDVLHNCMRKGRAENALSGLEFLIKTERFEVHTDFIAGLPGYTYNNLLADINRMIAVRPHEIQLELLKLLPGTCFRNESEKFGIKYSLQPPYEVLQTDEISYDELYRCRVLSKIIEYWYNDSAWRNIFASIVEDNPYFMRDFTTKLSGTDFLETIYSFESKSLILYTFCKENFADCLPKVILGWITNGLSIKKEPAAALKLWSFKEKIPTNPVFDEKEVGNSYYYIEQEHSRFWFVYNKRVSRNRPSVVFEEQLF